MYGWPGLEALGRNARELLRMEFSEPVETIEEGLLLKGHWEGEAVHLKCDGARLMVASRWDLQRGADGEPNRVLTINNDTTAQSTCDDLTGLWNRRMILDQLGRELNRTRHEQRPLAVALADIDLFKLVNDTHGHAVGDAVLRGTGISLQLQLRNYDFIGRYGGEEFLILLPGCDVPAGVAIAERLCARVASAPVRINGVDVPVTVSIGLSSTVDVGFDSETLIAAADAALYRAKAGGRNRVA
jgi:diguanylate cyclase (GGDEF)-like protein